MLSTSVKRSRVVEGGPARVRILDHAHLGYADVPHRPSRKISISVQQVNFSPVTSDAGPVSPVFHTALKAVFGAVCGSI